MSKNKRTEWPTSHIETIDREIFKHASKLASGSATSRDVSETSDLIRRRADYMMPGLLRSGGYEKAKKAG
ncbi:hypothetical protein [Methylocystis sp. B8]|uniref:hypothetical protein n=1 Tax=Methylocystis sp. B8 TaxID=544938 RepID=UPI0010FF3734|nr:hypothetical protein [Methylocystis sp. B8]TLG75550.1 hypothetical protein FEV16_10150 [Methylocystis sp. B8]